MAGRNLFEKYGIVTSHLDHSPVALFRSDMKSICYHLEHLIELTNRADMEDLFIVVEKSLKNIYMDWVAESDLETLGLDPTTNYGYEAPGGHEEVG